jgi:hypothetical protein
MSIKHPNESLFEMALRLTKAIKDQENRVLSTGPYFFLKSKTLLDIIHDELENPVDPTKYCVTCHQDVKTYPSRFDEAANEWDPYIPQQETAQFRALGTVNLEPVTEAVTEQKVFLDGEFVDVPFHPAPVKLHWYEKLFQRGDLVPQRGSRG